jgi:hypothetical protein
LAQCVIENGREVTVKMLENLKRDIKDFEREISLAVDLHMATYYNYLDIVLKVNVWIIIVGKFSLRRFY